MKTKQKNKVKIIRGVSRQKYAILAAMVRNGKTTWHALEKRGIVEPSKRDQSFRREVEKKLKGTP